MKTLSFICVGGSVETKYKPYVLSKFMRFTSSCIVPAYCFLHTVAMVNVFIIC